MIVYILMVYLAAADGKTDDSYKDQSHSSSDCTDPRTMQKHAAYSEWADAYSCTRHRCQPGGRNLAIYTVGCKRVEAPESAIECEEVVEDTNMQFPYCCTRLRCLVVVRGEVWTRVLGQPWETLPAAPWSHMYKMKKPPPSDETFIPKHNEQGPVYELQTDAAEEHDKVMRSSSKLKTGKDPNCKDPSRSAIPPPDIVIALTTGDDKDVKNIERTKSKNPKSGDGQEDNSEKERDPEGEEPSANDKLLDVSEEKFYPNTFGVTMKTQQNVQKAWSEIPQSQWGEPAAEESTLPPEEKNDKSGLQALVDAIGNRMRDIEDVVQRMSEKVVRKLPEHEDSAEIRKKHGTEEKTEGKKKRLKRPNPDSEHYKRFTIKNHSSKYLRSTVESTSDLPLYVEDTSLNGYFSDASNSVIRRSNIPKEPTLTYMAPVENHRKSHILDSGEQEKKEKHKKHSHKKKKVKGKGHKKHHSKDESKKRFNKISSMEIDKNGLSLEDSSAITSGNKQFIENN